MSTAEIRVRPTGWESAPEEEQFVISDMDHTMPKIYVQIVEVFKLARDAEKSRIVDDMVKGLEYTLSQFPILTGNLKMDAENGRLWVTKKRESSVGLSVRDVAESSPTYEELERSDFPAASFKGHVLLPKAVTEKQLFSPLGDNQKDNLMIPRSRSISSKEGLS
jgi:hypothetical protein